jgi:PPOX class probable FMN-dependent enzyme
MSGDRITTVAQLEALYGAPAQPSVIKETDRLTPAYRALIEASPFVVLASAGAQGLDCSPRGDAAGFVRVADENTLLLPDRRGNNRIDTLRNVVVDPRVALLVMVPGHGETLRINGRAEISVAPDLLKSFAVDGKSPRSVLVIAIERVYFQCARAVMRSRLWNAAPANSELPSAGEMLRQASGSEFDGLTYDAGLASRQKSTLY